MKAFAIGIAALLLLTGCKKMATQLTPDTATPSNQFIEYTIQQGHQFCDQSGYQPLSTSEMKFVVKFDSTAIYQTASAGNQYDINKLYGFSDNHTDHHTYSARFGWRWSDSALRLFAYVYNEGVVSSKELATVQIGEEMNCSIKPENNEYLFRVNDHVDTMPRLSTTEKGEGYQLYPYFGGDELAPHKINIWIRTIQ